VTLKGFCKQARKRKERLRIFKGGKDKLWLDGLRHPNFPGCQGKLQVSIEMMPAELASQYPAGLGRGDPNMNPYLPDPPGRVHWSLFHPFDMFRELLGPELCHKICCVLCCGVCIVAFVLLAPFFQAILGWFH